MSQKCALLQALINNKLQLYKFLQLSFSPYSEDKIPMLTKKSLDSLDCGMQ